MKNLFLLMCAALTMSFSYAQTVKRDTAMVRRVQGVPVFVMSEPLAAYEVTGNIDADLGSVQILNAVSGEQAAQRTIKECCEAIIENANRKKKKGKLLFDAIIVNDDGSTGTCIVWK